MLRRAPVSLNLAALLAVLALVARILVPAGYMPGAGSQGLPALVICSGQGPMVMAAAAEAMPGMASMLMHHGDTDKGQGGGQAADHPCPFAGFAAAVDFARYVPPALPFATLELITLAVRPLAHPGLGLAAPPPPKTGPPFLR